MGEGKYAQALAVITEKNPLPFITGTICAHNCMSKCTRNFYEDPVHIRGAKLTAAEGGFEELMKNLRPADDSLDKKVAIVGGGPAGMAAAFFLSRAGAKVTLFEQNNRLGGVVDHVIPGFRIPEQAIDSDASLVTAYGAEVKYNTKVESLEWLKERYDAVILAMGASKPGVLRLEQGETTNALEFLAEFKAKDGKVDLGTDVVVIGGGNTAMDTARAAKRTQGVEHVRLVYRRTRRYMPADEEELVMAMEDGVEFQELLAPKALADGMLLCDVMKLGEPDESGRRGVVPTGETVKVLADLVIAAVGSRCPQNSYQACGLNTDRKGRVLADAAQTKRIQRIRRLCESATAWGRPGYCRRSHPQTLWRLPKPSPERKLVRDYGGNHEEEDLIYPRRGDLVET